MINNYEDTCLIGVSNNQKEKIGEFIIFFSQVEWLMANAIFYAQIPTKEYSVIENTNIAQKYFKNILELNFNKKIELIKKEKFDTNNLLKVGQYRNDIAHGFVCKRGDNLIAENLSKKREISLSFEECNQNIELLKKEAAKLLNFIQHKGYKIG